jgi:hypothetical protein
MHSDESISLFALLAILVTIAIQIALAFPVLIVEFFRMRNPEGFERFSFTVDSQKPLPCIY